LKQKSGIIAGGMISSLGWRGRVVIFLAILVGLGKPLYALSAAVLQRYGSSHGLFVHWGRSTVLQF